MGGKRNDFDEIPTLNGSESTQPVLTMSWQHHARFVSGTNETQITLFDNHGKVTNHGDCNAFCSRGLHIAINDTIYPPTVQFLREFRHPSQLQAQSQGSVQPLSPSMDGLGNVFIGWGRCPSFTEHNALGETVMDVQFSPWHSDDIPDALDNYRAYKMDWSATPWWDPAIAARKNQDNELVIYVSWNGATEVAYWVVRGFHSPMQGSEDKVLIESSRTGFETKMIIGQTVWQFLRAEAIDQKGQVLRSTSIVDLKSTNLSVAYDTYETNSTLSLAKETAEDSVQPWSTTLILLVTGMATFSVVLFSMVAIWLWQRYRNYEHLKAEDFDIGPDECLDEDQKDDSEDEDDYGGSGMTSSSISRGHGRPLLSKTEGNT